MVERFQAPKQRLLLDDNRNGKEEEKRLLTALNTESHPDASGLVLSALEPPPVWGAGRASGGTAPSHCDGESEMVFFF